MVILYKRLLTQLDGKMGPALRVACMDVGEGRKQGGGSFAYRDVGKQRENGYGSFDWRFFRGNSNTKLMLIGPK